MAASEVSTDVGMAVCPNCGSASLVQQTANASTVCNDCGSVLEESQLTNGLQYQEDSRGSSSVVGTFVSDTGTRSIASTPSFAQISDSRHLAKIHGRKKISQVAAALNLSSVHVDKAMRYFMIAIEHQFIKGRSTQNVVAACLYLVCRMDNLPVMLIDFSDVLQVNVYTLGHTYLRFRELLHMDSSSTGNVPVVDPSLYIEKYAEKLEFGERKHLVVMSAMRLVKHMKRDWMQVGRRPSGVVAAALLIAARMHGFRRTQKEITRAVRICDRTLRLRLGEFISTDAKYLTVNQLNQEPDDRINDDNVTPGGSHTADPPALVRARARTRMQVLAHLELLNPDKEGAPSSSTTTAAAATTSSSSSSKRKRSSGDAGEDAGSPPAKRSRPLGDGDDDDEGEEDEDGMKIEPVDVETDAVNAVCLENIVDQLEEKAHAAQMSLLRYMQDMPEEEWVSHGLKPPVPGTAAHSLFTRPEAPDNEDDDYDIDGEADLSDMDDDEASQYVLSADEVKFKTFVWNYMNKEFMDQKAAKERLAREASEAEGGQPRTKTRRRRGPRVANRRAPSRTPGESLERSNKINTDTIRFLMPELWDDSNKSKGDDTAADHTNLDAND